MVRDGTDEEFYETSSDIFSSARGRPDIYFTSRTPTLLLAGELRTQGRKDYRREMLEAARRGRISVHYCYSMAETAGKLAAAASGSRSDWEAQMEQLREVYRLQRQGLVDLRVVERLGFHSGIGFRDQAMVHVKPPGSLETRFVRFLAGGEGKVVAELWGRVLRAAPRMNEARWIELLATTGRELVLSAVREAARGGDQRAMEWLFTLVVADIVDGIERPAFRRVIETVRQCAVGIGLDVERRQMAEEVVKRLHEMDVMERVGLIREVTARTSLGEPRRDCLINGSRRRLSSRRLESFKRSREWVFWVEGSRGAVIQRRGKRKVTIKVTGVLRRLLVVLLKWSCVGEIGEVRSAADICREVWRHESVEKAYFHQRMYQLKRVTGGYLGKFVQGRRGAGGYVLKGRVPHCVVDVWSLLEDGED